MGLPSWGLTAAPITLLERVPCKKSTLCILFQQLQYAFSMNQNKSFISRWQYKINWYFLLSNRVFRLRFPTDKNFIHRLFYICLEQAGAGSANSRKKNVPPAGSRRNKRREHRGYWAKRISRQRHACCIRLRKNRQGSSRTSRYRANDLLINFYRFYKRRRNINWI